jgi:hypothetical protein
MKDDEHHNELERIFNDYYYAMVRDAYDTDQCPRCFFSMLAAAAINGLLITTKGDEEQFFRLLKNVLAVAKDQFDEMEKNQPTTH